MLRKNATDQWRTKWGSWAMLENCKQMDLLRVTKIKKIPNSLPSDVFFKAQNAPKPFSAGALPRTPLGELTMLPQTP